MADALLRRDVEQLTEKVEQLENRISDLVTAWNTATTVLVFVKWAASLATASLALLSALQLVNSKGP